MDEPTYLTGQFLLAMPGIGDPRFKRAVIAMCGHDANGAIGIGISETVAGLGLHAVLDQVGIDPGDAPDAPIHLGGPVETQRGFVLHSLDWSGQDTIQVADKWALSGTLDALRAITRADGPRNWLVALGYAGWGAGQLDGELKNHGWLTVGDVPDMLFGTEADDRWTHGFDAAGIDPRLLAIEGGTA